MVVTLPSPRASVALTSPRERANAKANALFRYPLSRGDSIRRKIRLLSLPRVLAASGSLSGMLLAPGSSVRTANGMMTTMWARRTRKPKISVAAAEIYYINFLRNLPDFFNKKLKVIDIQIERAC